MSLPGLRERKEQLRPSAAPSSLFLPKVNETHPQIPLKTPFILAALILVLVNGVFVAAEFAIVRVRRTRLEELERFHVR